MEKRDPFEESWIEIKKEPILNDFFSSNVFYGLIP